LTQPDVQSTQEVRRRYRAFFEELHHKSFAQRYGVAIALGCLGALFVFNAIVFAQGAIAGISSGIAFIIFGVALAKRNAPKVTRRMQLAEKGIPVWGVLVQAHQNIFSPGKDNHYCLVLFSFEPAGGHLDYMKDLAHRVAELKETQQTDLDLRFVANLTTDERAVQWRRRRVPVSMTGGPTVYAADLALVRSFLRAGYITEDVFPCIAEPGEIGMLELMPWWIAAGHDSKPH
jgi:hypothetical protein